MRTFTDDNGREWFLRLDNNGIDAIRDRFHCDLLAVWDGVAVGRITADPRTFAQVMAIAVKIDTEEDARALVKGLRGDGMDRALEAFWAEVADFFPSCHRPALNRMIQEAMRRSAEGLDLAVEALAKMPADAVAAAAFPGVFPPAMSKTAPTTNASDA